jgi:protein-disulfide isomerase
VKVSRKDLGLLAILMAAAMLVSLALRSDAPIGTHVGDQPLARSVRQDRSPPVAENTSADVTLIVFTDYQCPACRLAHAPMHRAVARDGRVRVVYKEWPIFGQLSERAARMALAADYQGIYPPVHDALMAGGRPDDRALKQAVEQAGGSWGQLRIDLDRHCAAIDAQLARNREQAFGLGLMGTPGYLIGPILVRGALGEAEFLRAFSEARAAA